MSKKQHWETVYTTKSTDAVSWFQPQASMSLNWIAETGCNKTDALIDVGGGASTLVDDLLAAGFQNLTVLDLSGAALAASRTRVGNAAVQWIEADITQADLPAQHYDIWHDRAVFHFLVTPEERAAYREILLRSVKRYANVMIATFAENGPTQCSGLPVQRYSVASLCQAFGKEFVLLDSHEESHRTPSGATQAFIYVWLRRM